VRPDVAAVLSVIARSSSTAEDVFAPFAPPDTLKAADGDSAETFLPLVTVLPALIEPSLSGQT